MKGTWRHKKMNERKKELRCYILVPYNLSDIQKGIQAAHAIVEYSLGNDAYDAGAQSLMSAKFHEWATDHKTIIILNAGTTGRNSSMEAHRKNLDKLGVQYSTFKEPDLNDAMTAIAFICDMEEDSHIVGYLKQMRLA